MNDESVDATELTNMKTPLWDAEGTCEDNEVKIEEKGVEVEEDPTSDPELLDRELETKMDELVPPPVQQDVKLPWNSTPWYYGPEPIDDDVWSEDDEGVVEEMELEIPDYTTSPRVEEFEEEPLDKMEDENEERIPSWEEELGDELVGLPTLEDEEFDPIGDLIYLETLLEEKPTMEIKYTPNEEEQEVAEEFDSRPVEKLEDGPPPGSRTRERARKSLDQHLPRIQGWYQRKKKEKPLKFAQHHPSHYMPRIRMVPKEKEGETIEAGLGGP
ncbi:FK506-binding nuclear protein-like [Helianthus annuus]|uniref:FK506-binding nuclear protein-like n=1 Tax=Helianthus annuus TaxID=4232 RepID=UPI000B909DFE|nr:FK506-binding nuclear protein-like [Helianthus annuus]